MNDKTPLTSSKGSTPKPPATPRPGRRIVRYVLALVTLILIVDAIVGEKGLLALFQARREFQAVEAALAQSRATNAQLREEARRLREDASAVEELARRELGLIRPGEKLFIIKEAPKK
jgi:cell division protein FtsB